MCAHPSRGGAAYNAQITSCVHLTQALHTAQRNHVRIQQPRGGCRLLGVYLPVRGGPASAHEDHRREELLLLMLTAAKNSNYFSHGKKSEAIMMIGARKAELAQAEAI